MSYPVICHEKSEGRCPEEEACSQESALFKHGGYDSKPPGLDKQNIAPTKRGEEPLVPYAQLISDLTMQFSRPSEDPARPNRAPPNGERPDLPLGQVISAVRSALQECDSELATLTDELDQGYRLEEVSRTRDRQPLTNKALAVSNRLEASARLLRRAVGKEHT